MNDNILHISNNDGTFTDIPIDEPDVWQILLSRNPQRYNISSEAIEKYRGIVKQLGLLKRIKLKAVKNRNKYRLIGKGNGFLFTTTKPPRASTVFIPSNRKRLIRSLIQSLAELRAGNEAMRNTVIELAQAAKAKNILPPNLLTKEELTWMYA